MNGLRFRGIVAAATVAAFGTFGVSGAQAATCLDPAGNDSLPSISEFVTGDVSLSNSGCELGTTNNDSESQVNLDTMFGNSDWRFAEKEGFNDPDEESIDISFSVIGDTLSGTWSVAADFFQVWEELMIVAKDGSDTPPVYVGYLITSADGTSGSYKTPFVNTNPNSGQQGAKDISHLSAYVRRGDGCDPVTEICGPPVGEVPVPAGLPLLLSALGMTAVIKRRRRKAA